MLNPLIPKNEKSISIPQLCGYTFIISNNREGKILYLRFITNSDNIQDPNQ